MKTTKSKSASSTEESAANSQENELKELFLDELADVYSAEKQLTKALPKMAKAANAEELRTAFQAHLDETIGHVARLEQVAVAFDEKIKSKKCKAMEGLVEEGSEMMEEKKDSSALDAALIAAAQKVEHYEIATYGTLIAWATRLGNDEAVGILEETLDEEKAANDKLTAVAENVANEEAES